MTGSFEKLFDFDNDGKLGVFERVMQLEFLDEVSKDLGVTESRRKRPWERHFDFEDSYDDYEDFDNDE